MTNEEFCACLRLLKLSRGSAHSAAALGLSVRQLQRVVNGHAPVTPTLALLVIAYLKLRGVPSPLWNVETESIVRQAMGTRVIKVSRRAPPVVA